MINKNIIFLFDLDGTLTSKETLPIIAKHFNINDEISNLTKQTLKGDIPFSESFTRRVDILGKYSVSDINELLSKTPLLENVFKFIQENKANCIVVTGNFNEWIEKLCNKIGCEYFASRGIVENDKIVKLTNILEKDKIVKMFKKKGKKVVYVGDSNNDVFAMEESDISIASGIVHRPTKSVLEVVDYCVFSEMALVRLLKQIYSNQSGKSVVISCAGIGSRLGLGITKALIEINNKPLIHYHLDALKNVLDIRIVIGFQSQDVINSVLKKRKDIIFVYNHNYMQTKTGMSYFLGSRHANEYVIALDGDLLIKPEDMEKCLKYDGEFIGCSEINSDEPVFVKTKSNNVISFSRKDGDYEWVGPACLKRSKIKSTNGNVYNQLEDFLPLPIINVDAQDIDSYDDYLRAKDFINKWSNN